MTRHLISTHFFLQKHGSQFLLLERWKESRKIETMLMQNLKPISIQAEKANRKRKRKKERNKRKRKKKASQQ